MNKSILAYATILVLSLGASWMQYTQETPTNKTGVVLAEIKKDTLQTINYADPTLKVAFEIRKDAVGAYGWVTVTETKKKKDADGKESSETVTTTFKAGSAGDKLMETWAPLMALRELGKPEDDKIKDFGLTAPDTSLAVSAGGKNWNLDVGGETYGTKDRYVRDQATGLVYVLDDEVVKSFKYAKTKLKDTLVLSPKVDEIESLKVGRGANTVTWTQQNIVDRAAAFWTRDGTNKDENFSLWLDKLLKIRSMDYVQGAEPTDLIPVMDVTVKPVGKPEETLTIYKSGEDWYAKGSYTRALVKLNKTSAADMEDEIDDVIDGKAPPKPAEATPPVAPPTPDGPPPGLSPAGPGGPGLPPGGPGLSPGAPGLPPRPGMPMPLKPGSGPETPMPPAGSKPTGK